MAVAGPLSLRALHHVALAVRDAERSIAFYRDVLGFAELPRPPFDFRGAWLYRCGMQIHLIENPAGAPSPDAEIDTRGDHVAFAADDVAAARELLAARGIPFLERVNAGGIRQLFFHDPDGHAVEIAVHDDPSRGYVAPVEAPA